MASIATTFQTYQSKGNSEDLSDLIDNIAPTETPFYSMLKKKSASSVKFEWQTDSLTAAANNAKIEGESYATFTAVTPTVRWDNYAQISSKDFMISRSQEVIDKAGRQSEIDYQTLLKGKELKRDVEFSCFQNTTYNAGAAATARQTRGMEGWIYTTCLVGGGAGAAPVPASNTAPVAGTARALTEAFVKTASQSVYTQGGDPSILFVTPSHKTLVSAFAGNSTRNVDVDAGKLNTAISIYVTDFHTLKVVPARNIQAGAASVAMLVDPAHVKLRVLDPIKTHKMAKVSDAESFLVTYEWGLEVSNEKAHAQIRDLNA